MVCSSAGWAEVGGGADPAAERGAFGVKGAEEVQRKYTTTHLAWSHENAYLQEDHT